MFGHAFQTNKTISTKKWNHHWTINIFIHFLTTESHVSWGFPTKSSSEATAISVLRIHGRLRLEEPLDHGIVAFVGCVVQRCSASGATAQGKPRAEPNGRKGRKSLRKFGRLKSRSFGNCGHSKILPELQEHCGFEMFSGCFYDIELVEKTVACGVLSKPCQPCLQSRCTWINSNILQLYQTNLPMIGTPHHLKIIARFCSFAPGISFTVTGRTSSDRKKKLQFESCRNTPVTWVHRP